MSEKQEMTSWETKTESDGKHLVETKRGRKQLRGDAKGPRDKKEIWGKKKWEHCELSKNVYQTGHCRQNEPDLHTEFSSDV